MKHVNMYAQKRRVGLVILQIITGASPNNFEDSWLKYLDERFIERFKHWREDLERTHDEHYKQ